MVIGTAGPESDWNYNEGMVCTSRYDIRICDTDMLLTCTETTDNRFTTGLIYSWIIEILSRPRSIEKYRKKIPSSKYALVISLNRSSFEARFG